MKEFIIKHWFNLATLLTAVLALFISLRSNEISLNESTSKIEVIRHYGSYGIVIVGGCYNKNSNDAPYELHRLAAEVLTFVNRGGRVVSLVRASFSEGSGEYGSVRFSETNPTGPFERRELKLPLDIESGTGKIWLVEATNDSYWKSVKDALTAINYPDPQASPLPEIPKPAVWEFEFSDGSIVLQDYQDGWYHIQPEIDRHLQETPCK